MSEEGAAYADATMRIKRVKAVRNLFWLLYRLDIMRVNLSGDPYHAMAYITRLEWRMRR